MLEELNSQKLDHHSRLNTICEQLQKQKASFAAFPKESQQVLDETDSISLIRSADDLFARSKNLLVDPPVEIGQQTRLSVVFPDSKSRVIDDDRLHTFGRISSEMINNYSFELTDKLLRNLKFDPITIFTNCVSLSMCGYYESCSNCCF